MWPKLCAIKQASREQRLVVRVVLSVTALDCDSAFPEILTPKPAWQCSESKWTLWVHFCGQNKAPGLEWFVSEVIGGLNIPLIQLVIIR